MNDVTPDLRQMTPELEVVFGDAQWLAHLGGDFLDAEVSDGVRYRWVGGKPCWCVLPPLAHRADYAVRFEAAPFVPYHTELRELSATRDGTTLFRRIVPIGRETDSTAFDVPAIHLLPEGEIPANTKEVLKFTWRKLPPPRIEIAVNRSPLADLCYDPDDKLQPREFLLRQELLEREMVLYFRTNFSLTRREVDDVADDRALSFRFFRVLLYPLLQDVQPQ